MSFKAFVWAWDQEVSNPDHHHVLLALADITPARQLFASVPYIAKKVNRSQRKVRTALEALETSGVITITERPGKSDLIRLNIPANFMVTMPDEDEELERGTRGRPRKTPAPKSLEPLQNPSTQGADEAGEPQDEPGRANALVSTTDAARFAFDGYNLMASQAGLPLAQKLTDQRRRAIKARLKDCDGQEGWADALERVARSPFLTGKTDAGFRATLDFILQPSSFTKLIEGRYEDRHDRGSPASPTSPDRSLQRSTTRIDAMVEGAGLAVTGGRRRWW